MVYPKSLNNLIESYKRLPGVGEKTAERLALATLDFKKEELDFFAKAVIDVKNKIRRCTNCFNISETEICDICSDKRRDTKSICVVEDIKSVILFEKNALFDGQYHVLNGLISPINGVEPKDINIDFLLNRIKRDEIKELIIAVKPSLEGETTAMYITKKLENTGVLVTKIAHGIPMGADMEYIDAVTLEKALFERTKIS